MMLDGRTIVADMRMHMHKCKFFKGGFSCVDSLEKPEESKDTQ